MLSYVFQFCAQAGAEAGKSDVVSILPVLEDYVSIVETTAAITTGATSVCCVRPWCGRTEADDPLVVSQRPAEEELRAARETEALAIAATIQMAEDAEEQEMKAAEEEVRRAQERWLQRREAECMARADMESGRCEQEAARNAARKAENATLRAEDARKAQEAARQEKELASYLAEHKFTFINGPKQTLFSTTYPLHCAAELGNGEVVDLLLRAGADPARTDSNGKTAAEVAQRRNANGSHEAVLRRLAGCGGA